MRMGALRGDSRWVLLVSGRFSLLKPLSPEPGPLAHHFITLTRSSFQWTGPDSLSIIRSDDHVVHVSMGQRESESYEPFESSPAMVVRATKINPAMLRWARERAGYSVDEVARRRRVSSHRILNWESGEQFPTWRQLEGLAYWDYHRSPTMFFRDSPPDEKYLDQEFDRLPTATLDCLEPDTRYAVRQARMRQDDLSILQPVDAAAPRSNAGFLRSQAESLTNPELLASAIDGYFRSTLNRHDREWPSVATRTEPPTELEPSDALNFRGSALEDTRYPINTKSCDTPGVWD